MPYSLILTTDDLVILRDALVVAQLAHRGDADGTARDRYAALWDRLTLTLSVNRQAAHV